MKYNGPDDFYGNIGSPKLQKCKPYKATMSIAELMDILNHLPPDYIIGFPHHGSYLVIQNQARQYAGFINLNGKSIHMWQGLEK